jgi:hypothetical protein
LGTKATCSFLLRISVDKRKHQPPHVFICCNKDCSLWLTNYVPFVK